MVATNEPTRAANGASADAGREDRHLGRQGRPRPDAQGRRDHGRRHAGAREDRRGGGRLRRHGPGARPSDIRKDGGVARMSDPEMINGIIKAVTIPVMAKCRIGHFVEAQVLEALGVDYIDESEVLTPADEAHHVDKHPSRSRSSAAAATSARRCAGSAKARR